MRSQQLQCWCPSILKCFEKNKANTSYSGSVRTTGTSEMAKGGCLDVIKTKLLAIQIEKKLNPRGGGTCPRSHSTFGCVDL